MENDPARTESPYANREMLTPEFVPRRDGIVAREEEIAYLDDALNPVIFGQEPDDVLIVGPVGTGKSLCARYVVERQVLYAAEQGLAATFAAVDGLDVRTEAKMVRQFATLLNGPETGIEIPERGVSVADYYDRLGRILDDRYDAALLVLDRIEYLDPDTLESLVRFCRDHGTTQVTLVTLSDDPVHVQTLDPSVRDMLRDHEFTFDPYDATALREILDNRLEAFVGDALPPAVGDRVVSLATESEGARAVVDLMRTAGDLAEARGVRTIDEFILEEAVRVVEVGRLTRKLSNVTDHAWFVLEALRSLTADGDGPPRSAAVYDRYRDVCREEGVSPLSARRVRELLTEFDSRGVTEKCWHTGGRATGNFSTHRLRPDVATVERALSDTRK
jgi:cell division control protein 6